MHARVRFFCADSQGHLRKTKCLQFALRNLLHFLAWVFLPSQRENCVRQAPNPTAPPSLRFNRKVRPSTNSFQISFCSADYVQNVDAGESTRFRPVAVSNAFSTSSIWYLGHRQYKLNVLTISEETPFIFSPQYPSAPFPQTNQYADHTEAFGVKASTFRDWLERTKWSLVRAC